MIEEAYVGFETAKLLKEKGFDEPTLGNYYIDGRFEESCRVNWNKHFKTPISAPTQQMVMRWLREKYNIHILLEPSNWPQIGYWSKVYLYIQERNDFKKDKFVELKPTYEEAVEAAIKYCLENLI